MHEGLIVHMLLMNNYVKIALIYHDPLKMGWKAITASPCKRARKGTSPAGCSTRARTKRSVQELGRPSPFLDPSRLRGEPVPRLRRMMLCAPWYVRPYFLRAFP